MRPVRLTTKPSRKTYKEWLHTIERRRHTPQRKNPANVTVVEMISGGVARYMISLDLLGMISRAVKPMDIAVEIVDHSGGWGMEKVSRKFHIVGIYNATYGKHIGNPVCCKTTSTPNTQGYGGRVNIMILQ